MVQVLFVCLGNICRSPMAEAIFRDLVVKEGLEEKIVIRIISCRKATTAERKVYEEGE